MCRANEVVKICLLFLFLSLPPVTWGITFTRYLPDRIVTLDPLNTVDRYSQFVVIQIFDSLFALQDEMPKPLLAESYSYENQGKEIKIVLRKNVVFHDGRPFTADDVVFSIQRICNGRKGNAKILPIIKGCISKNSLGVRKINDFEVSLQLIQNFPPFISYLASPQFMILPQNFHGLSEAEFFRHPVGTGPFKLVSSSESKVVLAKNENYFRGNAQIDQLIGLIDTPERIYQRLKDESIDDIFPLSPPDHFPSSYQITQNNTASSILLVFPKLRKPFNNQMLRRAIRAAVQNDEIGRILKSHAGVIPGETVIPWGALGFNKNASLNFSLDADINELVKKAGYATTGDVPEFTICSALKAPFTQEIPELLLKHLINLGFRVRLKIQTIPELIRDLHRGTPEIILFSPTMASTDTYQFLRDFESTSASGFSPMDKQFDKTLSSALISSDRMVRGEYYRKADQILVERDYVIPLGHIVYQTSLRKKGWNMPEMTFLGPFLTPAYETAPKK
ncbi:MAG: hypothetical protein C5B49_14670 [Bdellovibrio sp.]|nr:MAG: hypothetical protein C5B49_14670 [Bdellovibrio sp.]